MPPFWMSSWVIIYKRSHLTDPIFLYVSVKPEERPSVVGFKPRHRVGDKLHMTCYINNTFPAANLTWFVAGKTVIILSLFEDIHSILNVGQNV